jgi:hypothetical protein
MFRRDFAAALPMFNRCLGLELLGLPDILLGANGSQSQPCQLMDEAFATTYFYFKQLLSEASKLIGASKNPTRALIGINTIILNLSKKTWIKVIDLR